MRLPARVVGPNSSSFSRTVSAGPHLYAGLCPTRHSTGLRTHSLGQSQAFRSARSTSAAAAAAPLVPVKCTATVRAKACNRHGSKMDSSRGSCTGSSRSSRRAVTCACSSSTAASYVVSAAVDTQQGGSSPANSEGQGQQQQQQQQQQHSQMEQELRPPAQLHLTHLVALSVRDFALVSNSSVRLQPGLTAISGTSGAGKSALIEALSVLLGATPPGDCVRPPAAAAVIEGSWWLGPAESAAVRDLLLQAGLPSKALPQQPAAAAAAAAAGGGDVSGGSSGGWLHLRREVSRNRAGTTGTSSNSSSRSRTLINGVATSLRVVRSIADVLVDVNGQAASQALRDTAQQLLLLDRIAGVSSTRQALSAAVVRLSSLESQLAQLESLGGDDDRLALQRRIDIIERAALEPGEDETLRRRLAAMEARRGCLETAAALQAALKGDGSGGGSRAAAAAGGSSLLEGLGLVMLQLRGLLSTEEQQQRLLLAERQKLRRSSSSNGAGSSDAGGYEGTEGGEDVEEGDDEDGEGGEEVDDDDEEVVSSAAGVSALRNALEELEAVEEGLREAQGQLSSYAAAVDYSAADAAAYSSRLDLITKLCRRFRCSRGATGLLDLQQQWSNDLEQYYASLGAAEQWRAEAAELQATITQLALNLSAARVAAAGRLAAAVQAQLAGLVMGTSRFAVRLDWSPAQPCTLPGSQALAAPSAAHPPMEPLTAQHAQQQQQQPDPGSCDASDTSSSVQQPAAQAAAAAAATAAAAADAAPAPAQQQLFRLSLSGLDSVTFLLAAGPSEPLRPLADVASGGEAARVMLALKAAAAAVAANAAAAAAAAGPSSGPPTTSGPSSSSLEALPNSSASSAGSGSGSGPPPVLVLDELDAGVGSRLGSPIGRLLQTLVAGPAPTASQVLVVTHTPQVAAHASYHIQALKGPGPDGRIISTFRPLTGLQDRLDELADMMGLMPQQQQQQQQQSDEVVRARQLAAQLLAAAQEGAPGPATVLVGSSAAADVVAPGDFAGTAVGGSNGSAAGGSSGSSSSSGSSVGDSSVFLGLSAAAAAAGAAAPSWQPRPAGSTADTPQTGHNSSSGGSSSSSGPN